MTENIVNICIEQFCNIFLKIKYRGQICIYRIQGKTKVIVGIFTCFFNAFEPLDGIIIISFFFDRRNISRKTNCAVGQKFSKENEKIGQS